MLVITIKKKKFCLNALYKTFCFQKIVPTQKHFKSMHKPNITDKLRLKFWSLNFLSWGRNRRVRIVHLSYPFCPLWQSRLLLVCKHCKCFVSFWLYQYFPRLFYNQCCYFKFLDVFWYFCAIFFVVLKINDIFVPLFLNSHPLSSNSLLFRILIWLSLYIWYIFK